MTKTSNSLEIASSSGSRHLAEVYATLTSMRPPRRASGDQVLLFIGNIRERLTLVGLDEQEYFQMLEA